MRTSLRWMVAAAASMMVLPLTLAAAPSPAAATALCHAPRIVGLSVTAARVRARASGCRLRLTGTSVKMPTIQTIGSQGARPGQVTKLLTASVNPLCPSAVNIGPPPGEPLLRPGPTELVTGLFIEGGALILRSAPSCKVLVGKSSAGTITVTNSAGTAVADNAVVTAGQLLDVTLSPGTYTVSGVFANGPAARPITVTVPSGEVVRQDLVLDVP